MKSKLLLTGFIYTLIGLLLMVQTNVVLAIASDEDNPITSAITSAINAVVNTDPVSEPISSPVTQPSPTPSPSNDPITAPITASPTPSPAPISAPISAPVLYEINPAVASPGETVTLRSFWNNLSGSLIFVGGIIMPDQGYQYSDNNTAVSFIVTIGAAINSALEVGHSYLVYLIDQFGGQSNSVQLTITAPVVNPTATPIPTPSPTQTPTPTPAPVTPAISTVFPNPATWGTHITLTGSNLTNSAEIYFDDQLVESPVWKPVEDDNTTLEFTMPLFTNHRANQTYKLSVRQNGIKSNEVNLTIAPSLAYNTSTPTAKQVVIDPQVNLDTNRSEVLIAHSNFNANISIPSSVTNPTLNFSDILISAANESGATFNNALTINANTSLGTVKVEIPTATHIIGPADWNGIINAPKILGPAGIKPTASAGKIAMTSSVIEVGLGDTPLTFDKAVRLLIPGQAGKLLGYQRSTSFTKITDNCSADTQAAGDSLPAAGDCYISVGNDLVVWTKHFTKFVTYTEAPVADNSGSQSSSSNTEAPRCGDSKPVSTPKLLSAKATGRNEVTLHWDKALDPVSYYLVAYSTKAGTLEYGNPNVGDKNTQSYVVKGLDTGKTYYFQVRAGNGCMPGEFSNELAVKVSGDKLNGPARGFKSGVLSSSKTALKFKPITEAKPVRLTNSSSSFLDRLFIFFNRFFRS